MIPYTDTALTIRVKNVDFSAENIRGVYVTLRQGQHSITFEPDDVSVDGEYVTVNLTQRQTSKFIPTTLLNAPKCEGIVNWVERISSKDYRRGSTTVNITVGKQLMQEVVNVDS